MIISGCDDPPNLKGRYVGERVNAGGTAEQVVAEVPNTREKDDVYYIEFDLVQTLASSPKERIEVRFNEEQVFLGTDKIRERYHSGVWIKSKDSCAEGTASDFKIKLCWTEKSIELNISSLASGNPLTVVNLRKEAGLPPPPQALTDPTHEYTLEELLGRSKFNSYTIEQEAERVFQAKEEVKVAAGNLLPRFNMRDLLSAVTGGLIELVGDLLPFLFPSNWYRWDESKALFEAERQSFAALRGNEMNSAEGLFYVIHRDHAVRAQVENHLRGMREIQEMIRTRELYGQMPNGSYDRFSLLVLAVEEDLSKMDYLLREELTALSHGVALPPSSGVERLAQVADPDFSKIGTLDPKDIFPQAQARSFETATMTALINASKSSSGERVYGFLDPTSNSTIGFGYAASIRVGASRVRELEVRKNEVLSLIEKSSVLAATQWNQGLRAYQIAAKGALTADRRLAQLYQRLRLGDDSISDETFVQELLEANEFVLKFRSARATAVSQFLIARSKVERLLLRGFYVDLEAVLPVGPDKQTNDVATDSSL